jgi:CheY-like chemotaxis protein
VDSVPARALHRRRFVSETQNSRFGDADVVVATRDERLGELIAEAIRDAGYPVVLASSAQEARRRLLVTSLPCLVIYMMSVDDSGADFLREHRSDPRTADVPVLLFSVGWQQPNGAPPPSMLSAMLEFVAQHCRRNLTTESPPGEPAPH